MGQSAIRYVRRSGSRGMRMQPKDDTKTGVWRRRSGESLLSELCRFNKCGVRTLGRIIRIRKAANLKHIQRECGALYADYRTDAHQIFPNDISESGANTKRAFGRHRCGATVEQYLFSRYKRTLRFSDLPCICAGTEYYPIECLRFDNDVTNDFEQKLNITSSSSESSSSSS